MPYVNSDWSSDPAANCELGVGLTEVITERKIGKLVWLALGVFFFLVCALFYVFAYNSGYGYDSLEYLVIGRALAHGQPFYSLIPSKSPAIYYFIATFSSLGLPLNHYTVSGLITLFFAAIVLAVWFAVRRCLGNEIAIASVVLVAACAVFMEMNFLEPEAGVFLCGLGAFVLVLRSLGTNKLLPMFFAGLLLAVGFQFKSVAAFYLVGIGCFLIFKTLRHHKSVAHFMKFGLVIVAGFLMGGSIPVLAFDAAGNLSEYWTWTIEFPLLHYPSNTFWLDKLFTKLLWFHLLLIVSLICALVMRSRRAVWNNSAVTLAFFMGLASYIALLKTQASHYCFPGAAFFCVFISAIMLTARKKKPSLLAFRVRHIAAAAMVSLIVGASAIAYRPQALTRFAGWRSFEQEALLGMQIREQVKPGEKGLFVKNGTLLYWVSGVQPAARFINFDVQTTYFLNRSPTALMDGLQDESTALVEFDSLDPGYEDASFSDAASRLRLLTDFQRLLEERFRPAAISSPPYRFWVRKQAVRVGLR